MLTVDMEAKKCWNKLIAFKPSKDSVYKVSRPKTVLYDLTLEQIETCTARAKNPEKTFEGFWVLVPKRNVMFHKIKILSAKVLSHFYAVCFGKAGFCKCCHVNRLELLVELVPSFTDWYAGLKIKIAKTRFTSLCLRNYLWSNRFFCCVMQSLFFVGNSWLDCLIIESIFDMSLVFLHTLVWRCHWLWFMSQKFASLNFAISNFHLVTSKFATLNFAISRKYV